MWRRVRSLFCLKLSKLIFFTLFRRMDGPLQATSSSWKIPTSQAAQRVPLLAIMYPVLHVLPPFPPTHPDTTGSGALEGELRKLDDCE